MIRTTFKINTAKVAQNLDHLVVLVQQKIALQILEGVVNMNPVLTGRSRGNWQVTIGSPASSEINVTDKDGGATITSGSQIIQTITELGAVYITNNVPYIIELEKGTSTQAPQGMVQVTLDRLGSQF